MMGCFLLPLLLIGAVVYLAGWRPQFGQWSQGAPGAPRNANNSALEIARERYARGEITLEEYQRLRDDLRD